MRTHLIIAALIFYCTSLWAQKDVVFIDYFIPARGVSTSDAEQIRNHVISGIQKINRVQIVDVDAQSALKLEQDRRSSEEAMGDQTSRMGEMKQLGAKYILVGSVATVDATSEYSESKKKTVYTGHVAFTIKAIKAEDGTIFGSKTIEFNGYSGSTGDSKNEAITNTLQRIDREMDLFVNNNFKLQGKIEELTSVKDNKLKTCYINLGSLVGLTVGTRFEVFEIKEVAGRKIRKGLGQMKVSEVAAEDLSLCKVTKGQKEILKAFKNGNELVVESTSASDWQTLGDDLKDIFK